MNPTAVAISKWQDITISATPTEAKLSVNGQLIATVPAAAAVSSFDGVRLNSTGTQPVGDHWLIDDVEFVTS